MTLVCVKTGVQAYLEEYGVWVYGDAFSVAELPDEPEDQWDEHSDLLVIRVAAESFQPINAPVFQIIVGEIDLWHDRLVTSMQINSTLITRSWRWHGYAVGHPETLRDMTRRVSG